MKLDFIFTIIIFFLNMQWFVKKNALVIGFFWNTHIQFQFLNNVNVSKEKEYTAPKRMSPLKRCPVLVSCVGAAVMK